MNYQVLENFPTSFTDLLKSENRYPEMIKKYTKPILIQGKMHGYLVTMCNDVERINYFNGKEKKILSKSGSELAPIIFFSKESITPGDRIYITEGESDAFAILSSTPKVISIPGARSNCITKNKNNIKTFLPNEKYEFCILFDNDSAGFEGANETKTQLLTLFPDSDIKVFVWDNITSKDIRDAIRSGELSFTLINQKLDLVTPSNQTSNLIDSLVPTEQRLKGPLDYYGPDGTLVFTFRNADKICFLESSREIKISENSKYLFLKPKEHTTLENYDLELFKKFYVAKSWSDFELLINIVDFIKRYVSSNEEIIVLGSVYILLSYIFPIFKYVPYLYINGLKGSGKSTFSEIITLLSFNGEHLTNPTPASFRRIIDAKRGLISFDDVEILASSNEETQIFRSQLNSGYETRSTTTLCSMEDNSPQKLYIGGPKIFNSIDGLENVLASRSIFIKMKANNGFKGERINKYDSSLNTLRTRILFFSMFNHSKISQISEALNLASSRDNDLLLPLLSISKYFDEILNIGKFEPLVRKAFEQSKFLKKESWSFEMCLVDAITKLWKDKGNPKTFYLLNGDIKSKLYLYTEECIPQNEHNLKTKIGRALRALELIKDDRRIVDSAMVKGTEYEIKLDLLDMYHKQFFSLTAHQKAGCPDQQ